jgi:four helix bundle protein
MSSPFPRKPTPTQAQRLSVTSTVPEPQENHVGPVEIARRADRGAGRVGLHVYRVALDFYRLVFRATKGRIQNERVDQLVRAAESVIRNIGEGHPTVGADRARRFRVAANEACECATSLDILEIRGELAREVLEELRDLLDRVRAMLWRLSRPR